MAKQMGKPRPSADVTREPRSTTQEGLGIPYDSIQKKKQTKRVSVDGIHLHAYCLFCFYCILKRSQNSQILKLLQQIIFKSFKTRMWFFHLDVQEFSGDLNT